MFATMLRHYYEEIDKNFHPLIYFDIQRKYKWDYDQYVKSAFRRSKLVSFKGISELMARYPENENSVIAEILEDPLYKIFATFSRVFNEEVFCQV
jgi:hypothetical protein